MELTAEKIGHVKNSLTIVAVFAGLVEIGGTLVLPHLEPWTQAIYVWFLMAFPFFLVSVFFLVLYKKHYVLYAPSDFRDDAGFLQASASAKEVRKNLPHLGASPSDGAAPAGFEAATANPAFAALSPQARKVLRTLSEFQEAHFPTDSSQRWGFTVGPSSPEYWDYVSGVAELKRLGLASVGQRNFSFLTDQGLLYSQQHKDEIKKELNYYRSFSN